MLAKAGAVIATMLVVVAVGVGVASWHRNIQHALSVEAALVMNSGDVKPAARQDLYLLDIDIERFFRETQPDADYDRPDVLTSRSFNNHVVTTSTTDFAGNATLKAKPGSYWLYAQGHIANNYVIWNVPADLRENSKIVLDNSSARLIRHERP